MKTPPTRAHVFGVIVRANAFIIKTRPPSSTTCARSEIGVPLSSDRFRNNEHVRTPTVWDLYNGRSRLIYRANIPHPFPTYMVASSVDGLTLLSRDFRYSVVYATRRFLPIPTDRERFKRWLLDAYRVVVRRPKFSSPPPGRWVDGNDGYR